MVNLKLLRDYLNSLDLDNISAVVNVVYNCDDITHCDSMADFSLVSPDDSRFRPYLSIYTDSFIGSLENPDCDEGDF